MRRDALTRDAVKHDAVRRLIGIVAAWIALTAASAAASADRHLVVISIDALRPEFYLDEASPAKELRALMKAGSYARAAEPVFPSVTYPGHAAIVTGFRPARHGVPFNIIFDPAGGPSRWYEEAADLRAPPLWEWARAAGLRTAAVYWPSTLGARIDALVPERNYYQRSQPVEAIRAATTPGLFERLGVTPRPEIFGDIAQWDAFLTSTAVAMIRDTRPNLLLIHLVQMDYFQHGGGRQAPTIGAALTRIDRHVAEIVAAFREAGLGARTTFIVTGDHGFQDVQQVLYPNEILARAGLGGCRRASAGWRASAHVSGGAAAVFVNRADDVEAARLAEVALMKEAPSRFTVLSRAELDHLGAMTGAAFGLEAEPGYAFLPGCGSGVTGVGHGGTHGFLPSRPSMATGFIASGAGVRQGVALERVRLIDVAPTAARLLGLPPPEVEGRVLEEILP